MSSRIEFDWSNFENVCALAKSLDKHCDLIIYEHGGTYHITHASLRDHIRDNGYHIAATVKGKK